MPSLTPSIRFLSNITKHSYSPRELGAVLRKIDAKRFAVNTKTLETDLLRYSNDFFKTKGEFSSLNRSVVGDRDIFSLNTLKDILYVRRTNAILKASLRLGSPNRDSEVRQIIQVLNTEKDCKILRIDIRSFFETLNFSSIVKQLADDGFRNRATLDHLESINAHLVKRFGLYGLPRGLPISSTLADYALYDFDSKVTSDISVVYYTRYVDDICIVHFGDNEVLRRKIIGFLKEKKLTLNPEKTRMLTAPSSSQLEFLGSSGFLVGKGVAAREKKS